MMRRGVGRVGRPGLVGTVARTAVVAGTATAVVGGVSRHQAAKAQDAAAQVVPLSKRVGATAAQGVEQGVHDAREWAAPRIEDAANAVSETVAPKVSAALKATARRVDPKPSKARRLLGWPGAVGLAVLVAAGAAVAIVLRKRQPEPAPPYPDEEAEDAASTAPAGLDAEVNGRVRQP